MKDNKQFWTTIVVALVVAIVVSVLTVFVIKENIGLAPAPSSADTAVPVQDSALASINAHQCTRDSVCETNIVKVNQGLCSDISSEIIIKVLDLAKSGKGIHLKEGEKIYRSEFFVIPEELYEVRSIFNSSVGFADDFVRIKNVITGNEREHKATSEGKITGVTMGGKEYTIMYHGAITSLEEDRWIEVIYPQTAYYATMDLSLCF